MDDNRFDNISRAVARGTSRRAVLRGLAGSLAAGLIGPRASGAAAPTRQPVGAVCTRATQCQSLGCVDGVCCDTACTGQYESCASGTCLPVSGAPVGNRPACPGSGVCQATCDGVTRTHCAAYPGGETSCGDPTCAGGFETAFACGGNGACHPTTTSCGLFVCGPTACLDVCASDADCVGAAHCVDGVCQGDQPLGEPCADADECQSSVCAQGVCCASACDGACRACNVPGNEGFCTEIPDGGACDGGVCCDGDCVDLQSDLEHCGACDNACRLAPGLGSCEDDPICLAGTCTFTAAPAGTVCRPVAGACDPAAEVCDGSSLDCPPDTFAAAGTVCRSAAGPCDVAEVCSGTGPDCPADGFAPAGTVCRPAADACDAAEVCTGAGPDCLADQPFCPGTTCCEGACCPDADHTCDGTICVSPAICKFPGEECAGPEDCCSGRCKGGTVCDCGPAGSVCEQGGDCCAGTCDDGVCGCITPFLGDAPCRGDADCCTGFCVDVLCVCKFTGVPCDEDRECCSGTCINIPFGLPDICL